jgi:hypothetical protein
MRGRGDDLTRARRPAKAGDPFPAVISVKPGIHDAIVSVLFETNQTPGHFARLHKALDPAFAG